MGLSPARVIGVDNGENDQWLIRTCGLGVAVSNAVPSLKKHADWFAKGRGPEGMVELIGKLLAGDVPRARRERNG